jgi:hypothetical protein
MADGRRHIAEFCFSGDCFGLPASGIRAATAEAIGDVVVMRYPQRAADRPIDETPRLAREMYNRTLRELTQTQTHTFVLSRMTAPERLASFLLELAERRDTPHALEGCARRERGNLTRGTLDAWPLWRARRIGTAAELSDGLFRYILVPGLPGWGDVVLLTSAVFLLEVVPLELQRRVVNDAVKNRSYGAIVMLCGAYAAAVLVQGATKLGVNIYRSWVGERAKRDLRRQVGAAVAAPGSGAPAAADLNQRSAQSLCISSEKSDTVAEDPQHDPGSVGRCIGPGGPRQGHPRGR